MSLFASQKMRKFEASLEEAAMTLGARVKLLDIGLYAVEAHAAAKNARVVIKYVYNPQSNGKPRVTFTGTRSRPDFTNNPTTSVMRIILVRMFLKETDPVEKVKIQKD